MRDHIDQEKHSSSNPGICGPVFPYIHCDGKDPEYEGEQYFIIRKVLSEWKSCPEGPESKFLHDGAKDEPSYKNKCHRQNPIDFVFFESVDGIKPGHKG